MLFVCALILIAYNNCGRIKFAGDTANMLKLVGNETIVGNPMTTAAKTLMTDLCSVVTRCHPEISEAQCETGLLGTGEIDYQVGLQRNTYQNFSAILQAEAGGVISGNQTAMNTCSVAVAKLQCSDPLVQAAYDPGSQSFAGLALMIPTTPGSCPAVFSQPPSRSEYFVATNGSDANDGSVDHPWATIDHAAQAAKPGAAGATIHVASGTYSLPSQPNCSSNGASCGISTNRSGLAEAPIVYISDEQGGAKLVAPGASATWYNAGDYVEIDGFEIVGTASSNFGILSEGAYGRIADNHIHGIPVTNGCATNFAGAGIFFGYLPGAHDNDAIGNVIHDIGPRLANGLPQSSYCQGMALGISYDQPGGNVENNIIYGVDNWGISTWHFAKQLRITHNLLFNNGSRAGNGTLLGGAILISGEAGVSTHDDTTVANNILRNNSGKGLHEITSVGNKNAYLNNLMFSNGADYDIISGVVPTGTLTVDPQMVDFEISGSGNYRLQVGSLAIDSGTAACAAATGNGNCSPATDATGFLRVFGASEDIGPFEWHP
jgi:hypothetical protein